MEKPMHLWIMSAKQAYKIFATILARYYEITLGARSFLVAHCMFNVNVQSVFFIFV